MAGRLRAHAPRILAANAEDVAAASGMIDRLRLDEGRVEAIAHSLEEVAALPDPLGVELDRWSRPNGLDIARVRPPTGVIGLIYESRPNVTAELGRATCRETSVSCLGILVARSIRLPHKNTPST